jgi:hypothetical protein
MDVEPTDELYELDDDVDEFDDDAGELDELDDESDDKDMEGGSFAGLFLLSTEAVSVTLV